jgi:hypothetical protein
VGSEEVAWKRWELQCTKKQKLSAAMAVLVQGKCSGGGSTRCHGCSPTLETRGRGLPYFPTLDGSRKAFRQCSNTGSRAHYGIHSSVCGRQAAGDRREPVSKLKPKEQKSKSLATASSTQVASTASRGASCAQLAVGRGTLTVGPAARSEGPEAAICDIVETHHAWWSRSS